MNFFDLHCDTLYEVVTKKKDLIHGQDLHLSIDKGKYISNWTQCFAVWIPEELRGDKAKELFNRCADELEKLKPILKESNVSPILTVEGGAELIKDLNDVDWLHEKGVKIFTLTWNGRCVIGDGVKVKDPRGITDFGKTCVKKLQEKGIVVDISHASERLFWDVIEIAEKPVIASHSNSNVVCANERNLTDDQFKAIKNVGGIVGITFCDEFLKSGGGASLDDILNHVEHFLSLGGEDVLCIGSDFDGADILKSILGIESIKGVYEHFLKHNYNETIVKKVFFENAHTFFISL